VICAGVFLLDYLIMGDCIIGYMQYLSHIVTFSADCSYNLLKKISMFSIEVLFIINFDS